MPFIPAPNVIEQSNFDGGYAPDAEDTGQEPNILIDVLNLLPDLAGSDALVVRKGFRRLREELADLSTHYVKHIWPFRGAGTSYLICVVSNDLSAANNVRLYAINLNDNSVQRIDTAGRNWANPDRPHWGMGIQEIFYGGSPGNDVYSWNPVGPVWNATAHTKTYNTLIDGLNPGAGQVARDFAFRGKEVVTYSSNQYTPARGIRYDVWENGQQYVIGDRISLKIAIGGSTYWRSYRCIKGHEAATASNRPGDGTDWKTYWKKVRLPLPVNADGETSDKWYFKPVAPGTSVAQWYADRLWLRYDGQGDKSRVLFSAPVKPEKGADVPDVVFDMTDFSPGNDVRGPGGGWIPFNDGRKGGVVEAMWAYGSYLIVFKRQATFVLSGKSEETFSVRRLSRHIGAVSPQAVTELDSLVYFLSDDGLYVTDGTAVEPVMGNTKVKATIEARIDKMHAEGAAGNLREATVWTWNDRVWFSLPWDDAPAGEKHWTFVYDPKRAAFYKTDLPVLFAQVARHQGIPRMYFSAPTTYSVRDLVYVYDHPNAGNQDDTGLDTYAAQDIPWHLRTTWWPFGLLRNQRRIRRVWAVVRGTMTFTLKAYRDWVDSEVKSTARAVSGSDPVHIEGEHFADSHAVSFRLSGTKAPAAVYGVAVHTEPRRARYHV